MLDWVIRDSAITTAPPHMRMKNRTFCQSAEAPDGIACLSRANTRAVLFATVSPMSLVSFLPPLALSMLSEGPIPDTGLARDCAAAVLFVDISGFTRLADVATTRFGDKAAE